MQPDHRAVNDEASRKPIKHCTDFAVITCEGSWRLFTVSVRG